MKQIIVLILFVLGGICFAEPDSQAEYVSESKQEVALPAYQSDSAFLQIVPRITKRWRLVTKRTVIIC